jgi:hypothetical protein
MASEGSFCFRKNIFLRNIIKESSERKGGKQKQKKKAEGGVCCGRVGVLSPAGHKKKAALR